MDVEELVGYLPKYAIDVLKERGIKKLFPPQAKIIKDVFKKKNLLLAMPTASGKTLLAEFAMIREIILGGKCLYVVPLKALANEKFEEFSKWGEIGIKVGISTGDFESREEHLANCDIVVTTSEKADSLVRNSARWIRNISCLVIDELHLLDSADRGATLEILLVKMKKINKNLRILGLSATAPNIKEIADWLDATYFVSEWRPVPLFEGILCRNKVEMYKDGEKIFERRSSFVDLVIECLSQGGGVLIFEPTRRNSEITAEKLVEISKKFVSGNDQLSSAILEENDGDLSQKLARCVRFGTAFHHAGLLASQRKIVEKGFRDGKIKIVVSTPTLAAGVNLPARRVIIKSLYRYNGYSRKIKVAEYKQMSGRAGRPGLDEVGESIVVIKSKDRKLVVDKYLGGKVEPITSKLGIETNLRFHTLALICEGHAKDFYELESFFKETFFYKQTKMSLRFELARVVNNLIEWGMVKEDSGLIFPTTLGSMVSGLYIDPLTGYLFYAELRKHMSDIGLLHLICRTPDMERLYIRSGDDWVEEEAFKLRNELSYYPSTFSVEYDIFLAEIKTALCLLDWINEVDENTICKRYSIAPGDLRRILETAEWLAHALSRISEYRGLGRLENLASRIRYGVRDELLPLVKLRGVGRVRARKLFNSGFRTPKDILAKRNLAERILGPKIVENLMDQLDKIR